MTLKNATDGARPAALKFAILSTPAGAATEIS
jgi:hypothetical protein